MNENLKKLYEALSPYVEGLGTYDEFSTRMDNEENRRRLYDLTKGSINVGETFDDFNNLLGFVKEDPVKVAEQGVKHISDTLKTATGYDSNRTKQAEPTQDPEAGEYRPMTEMEKFGHLYTAQQGLMAAKKAKRSNLEGSVKLSASQLGGAKDNGYVLNDKHKLVKSYTSADGEQHDDKFAADLAEAKEYKRKANMTISGQLRNLNDKLAELEAKSTKIASKWTSSDNQVANMLAAQNLPQTLSADKEYRDNELAIRTTKEAIKNLEEQRDAKSGAEDHWFIRRVGREVGDIRTWDFGRGDMLDAMTMLRINNKLQSGKELNDAERDAVSSIYTASLIHGADDQWARWGSIAGSTLGFVKDFLLTGGGFSSLGGKIATKVPSAIAKKAAEKMGKDAVESLGVKVAQSGLLNVVRSGGKNAVRKLVQEQGLTNTAAIMTTRALGVGVEDMLVRAPIMTATVQGQNLIGDIIKTKLGNVVVDGETGQMHFANDKDWGASAYEAAADRIIENASEMWGEHLPAVTDVTKALGARSLTAALLRTTRDNAGTVVSKTANLMSKMGLNGVASEILEEYDGQVWRSALGLDSAYYIDEDGNKRNNLTNPEFHADIWAGIGLSMGMTGGVAMGAQYGLKGLNGALGLHYKHQLSKADKKASLAFGAEDWDLMRSLIDATTNEDIPELVDQISKDDNYTDEQRKAVMSYIHRELKWRGHNLADVSNRKNGLAPGNDVDEIDQSYLDGYDAASPQEMTDIHNLYNMQRQRMAGIEGMTDDVLDWITQNPVDAIADYQSRGVLTDEQMDVVLDFINAYEAYNGMLQRVGDDIDSQVQQSNDLVDSHTHKEDGVIHTAVLNDDRKVYIVDGHLTINDAGGIDTDHSAHTFTVRDAETNQVEMISPQQISSMDDDINPDELKDANQAAIRDKAIGEARRKIEGVADLGAGMTFTLDKDGTQINIVIAPNEQGLIDNGDGTINVTDGQEVFAVDKAVLQQQVDAANQQRVKEAEEQRRIENEKRKSLTAQKRELHEQGTRISVQDADGNVIMGTVASVDRNIFSDNDKKYVVQFDSPVDGKIAVAYSQEEIDQFAQAATPEEEQEPDLELEHESEEVPAEPAVTPTADNEGLGQEPEQPAQPASALETITKMPDGTPDYEHAETGLAWDALIVEAEGDTNIAVEVINEVIEDKRQELKAAEAKLKAAQKEGQKKPTGPVSIAERIKAAKSRLAAVEEAQRDVDAARFSIEAWEAIAQTPSRRAKEAEAERKRIEREAKMQRKAEEEARMKAEQEAERREREALEGVPDMADDTPANARARGYRRMAGHKIDRQQPIAANKGKEVNVKFADKVTQKGNVALIEADQLQPSHNQGQRNPAFFLDEAQPKDRIDQASVAASNNIASVIRPEEITSSITAYTGAPTVNTRGEIIQGNSRGDALKQMYINHADQAEKYKKYLIDHADEFGLKRKDIEAMQRPVLVNMADVEDDEAIALGQYVDQDTETGGTERIKAKNTYAKIGDKMDRFVSILLDSTDNESSFMQLLDKNGRKALDWMNQQGLITPTQHKSALTDNGYLTEEAKNDLQGIMYQTVFGEDRQLETMFAALPVKAQRSVLATAYRDNNSKDTDRMMGDIRESIKAFYALSQDETFANAKNRQDARAAAESWKKQYRMDDVTGESLLNGDKFSNFAVELATLYKGESQKFIQSTFNEIYDIVQGTKESTLFEEADNTPRSLAEAINQTLNFEYDGQQRNRVVAGNHTAGQEGQQGSTGNARPGKPVENREWNDDRGGRTNTDSREDEITEDAADEPLPEDTVEVKPVADYSDSQSDTELEARDKQNKDSVKGGVKGGVKETKPIIKAGTIVKNNEAGGEAVAVIVGSEVKGGERRYLIQFAPDLEAAKEKLFFGDKYFTESELSEWLNSGRFAALEESTVNHNASYDRKHWDADSSLEEMQAREEYLNNATRFGTKEMTEEFPMMEEYMRGREYLKAQYGDLINVPEQVKNAFLKKYANMFSHQSAVEDELHELRTAIIANKEKAELKAEADAKQQKEEEENKKFGDFLDGKTPLQRSSIVKTLTRVSTFGKEGVMSMADFIEKHAAEGTLQLKTTDADKLKGPSRRQFNRMDASQQAEAENRVKQAGKKTEYLINGFLANKTAYEYAEHLLGKTNDKNKSENHDIQQPDKKAAESKVVSGDKQISESGPIQQTDELKAYSITPAQYTTKKGNVLDMQLVTPTSQLDEEQVKKATKFAKERKGWYDFAKGGFMMRSEEDAKEIASFIEEMNTPEQDESVEAPKDVVKHPDNNTEPINEGEYKKKLKSIGVADIDKVINEYLAEQPEFNQRVLKELDHSFNEIGEVNEPIVKKYFDNYGITTSEEYEAFFANRYAELHKEGKMKNHDGSGKEKHTLSIGNKEYKVVIQEESPETAVVLEDPKTWVGRTFFANGLKLECTSVNNNYATFDNLSTFIGLGFEVPKVQEYMRKGEWVPLAVGMPKSENPVKQNKPKEKKTKPAESSYGANNKMVTNDQYEALKARMKKKLNQLNMGMDPEMIEIGTMMAVYHFEAGARKFADYAKHMIDDCGDGIRPYLKSFYNAIRDYPGINDAEMTPYDEVRAFDVANFDKIGTDVIALADEFVKEDTIEKKVKQALKPSTNDKPASELEGDSAEYQEQQKEEKSFVNDIIHGIEDAVINKGVMQMADVKSILKDYARISALPTNDIQELVELALTNLTRRVAQDDTLSTKEKYDNIVAVYNAQPLLNARDSTRIELQQYSTPTPFGFLMGQFMKEGREVKSMMEPSAGNGALTICFDPAIVHVNDIDPRRLTNLRTLGYKQVTGQDALLPFEGEKVDAVATNPPFGNITVKEYDNIFKISSLEGQMAINALDQMKDNGRAAIIIGGNTEYRDNGAMKPKDLQFFGYLYSHYNVTDVINIDGAMYARNGTKYPVRIILIDGRKTGEFKRAYPPVKSKGRAEQVTTFEELYNRINNDILQLQQVGNQAGNSYEGTPAINGGNSKEDSKADHPADTGVRTKPIQTGGVLGSKTRVDSDRHSESGTRRPGANADGNQSSDGMGNGHGGNAGSSSSVQKRESGRFKNQRMPDLFDGPGRSGGNDARSVPEPSSTDRARLEVGLTDEKVAYPNRSQSGTLMSVVPANQAQVLSESLAAIGDVDQFLVDELGYANKEELFDKLAAEQVDSVALAIHQMNNGKAFIIGDMTGVGKGRQGAALIRYAVKKGKKPIYFTQKAALFADNYRDLCDIGSSNLRPYIIASSNDGVITDAKGNVVHKLPTKKEVERVMKYVNENGTLPDEYDYVLCTYDQVNSGTAEYEVKGGEIVSKERKDAKRPIHVNGQKRRDFIEKLASKNIMVLDESHTVGGDGGGSMFMRYLMPKIGGVTFLSATFAKRADNMPLYAMRTAISDSGIKPDELIDAVSRGGVTLQEIMSKQLVQSGQMIRRERSFQGVSIDWLPASEEADMMQRAQFNEVAEIFSAIRDFQNRFIRPLVENVSEGLADKGGYGDIHKGTEALGVMNVPFASKMYNLVNQLLFALKAEAVADRVIYNLQQGFKPVVSFTNTMEGFLEDAPKNVPMDEIPNFSLTLVRALDGVMRYQTTDADGKKSYDSFHLRDLPQEGQDMYNNILKQIKSMSNGLPISPMDAIRMKIEAAGYRVGEITGRNTQLIKDDNDKYMVVNREDKDKKAAAREFNNGQLDVLMINKSGSTGISLHASPKFDDKRQRVMVFAQFQSDINDEVQMRGRIDRTGQLYRGKYEYLMSSIPAEQRLQMMFKAKLKSLDANTTSSQKSKFNEMEVVDFLNKYGDEVVTSYMLEHPELEERLGDPLKMFNEGEFVEGESVKIIPDASGKIARHLAFLPVEEQEVVFKEISDAYNMKIQMLNDAGENDLEITTMPLRAKTLSKKLWTAGKDPDSDNAFADNTYLEEVEVDVLKKPMTFDEAHNLALKLLDGKQWGEYRVEKEEEIAEIYDANAESMRSKITKQYAEKAEKVRADFVKKATKSREDGKNGLSDDDIAKMAIVAMNDVLDRGIAKIKKVVGSIEARRDSLLEMLDKFTPGQTLVINQELDEEQMMLTLAPSKGMFLGFKFSKDYTLGSSSAVFATLDGRRKVEIPLSKAKVLKNILHQTVMNKYLLEGISSQNWDKNIPERTRKKAYIVTGNLMQALVDTKKQSGTKGYLVSYSTEDGRTKQGILMPDRFEPKDLRKSAPISIKLPQLRSGEKIESEDGKVTIERTYGWLGKSDYTMKVPKSSKSGAKYFADKSLRSLVFNNEFETKGNSMVAYIKEDNIAKVLDRLSKLDVTVLTESKLKDVKPSDGEDLYREVTDDSELAWLENQPTVKAYRAMQVIDGRLYSPMASGKKKDLGTGYGLNAWDVATEMVFNVTDDMMAEVEKLNLSDQKGYVEVIPGKLRFVKDSKTGKATLRYHLVTDETDVWAAYNPYNHNSDSMLNDQFKAAYRRGNLVVVEAEVPTTDLSSGYHAPYAKDAVGETEWKSGDVASQFPKEMHRTVYLSRYTKPVRVLSNTRVAEWIADRLRKAEKLTGKPIVLYEASFHPEVKKLLEAKGFEFVPVKQPKGKVSKILEGHPDYMSDEKIAELNKALQAKDSWMQNNAENNLRPGVGFITDSEVSYENDPISKVLGKSRFTKKQQSEYAARTRARILNSIQEMAKVLHLDNIEIVTDSSLLEGKKAKAKGFYNKRTGKITIVVPNHASVHDAQLTLLHEAVAHYGLRKLFGNNFDIFLDNVYNNAEEEVRRSINQLAAKHGWDFRKATEEYIATLAEDTALFNKNYSWFQKLKQLFLDMLNKIGLKGFTGVTIGDNELRYILWRSYRNLEMPVADQSPLAVAEDIAMQDQLQVGNYSTTAAEGDLFRENEEEHDITNKAQIRDEYERLMGKGMFQAKEALLDSMLSLQKAMLMMDPSVKYVEEIADHENAYLGENALSSINHDEVMAAQRFLFQPMLAEVAKLAKNNAERERLTDYMMAKHGLERNDYMRARDAEKQALKEMEEAPEDEDELQEWQEEYDKQVEYLIQNSARDYSGLTALTGKENVVDAEIEARQMVEDYEADNSTDELWKQIRNVNNAILSKMFDSGFLDRETNDKITSMYEYYIPLRGFEEATSVDKYAYLSSSEDTQINTPVKKAKGRNSKADDPLANMASMMESAIMQGNRNQLVKQRFLNFVLNHPSDLVSVSELYLQYDVSSDAWEAVFPEINDTDSPQEVVQKVEDFNQRMEQLVQYEPDVYAKASQKPDIPYKVVTKRNMNEHQVIVKRNGKDVVLTINGNPRLAQAVNGLTNPDNTIKGTLGSAINLVGDINRTLAGLYTTHSVNFIASNFFRDGAYSNAMVWVKEDAKYAARYNKNYAKTNPFLIIQMLNKDRTGELDFDNETERLFAEFLRNGGETGYNSMMDMDEHHKQVDKLIKAMNGILPMEMARKHIFDMFGMVGRAIEIQSRFATYATSRQVGRSVGRSIWDAKESTVNFNKKGAGGKFWKAAGQTAMGNVAAATSAFGRTSILFWNAALQATANNFAKYSLRNKKKALAAMAFAYSLGLVMPWIAQSMADGDDDDSYYDIPIHTRRENIMVRLSDRKWIKLPLPQEVKALYGLGELCTSASLHDKKLNWMELGAVLSQLSPIDLMSGFDANGEYDKYRPFIPGAVSPLYDVERNKSWTGLPIYKDTPFNKDMPEWAKAYDRANPYLVSLCASLNEATGGNPYHSGEIDINPANLEYLLSGYTGGIWQLANQFMKIGYSILDDGEKNVNDIPAISRFLYEERDRTTNRDMNKRYFELKKEREKFRTEYTGLSRDRQKGILDYAERLNELQKSKDFKMFEVFDAYENALQRIRNEKKLVPNDMVESLDSIEASIKAAMLDNIEAIREEE